MFINQAHWQLLDNYARLVSRKPDCGASQQLTTEIPLSQKDQNHPKLQGQLLKSG
jgi:hypothetical protein